MAHQEFGQDGRTPVRAHRHEQAQAPGDDLGSETESLEAFDCADAEAGELDPVRTHHQRAPKRQLVGKVQRGPASEHRLPSGLGRELGRVGDAEVLVELRHSLPFRPSLESTACPYLTSTTALELAALPRSLLVIGGGYIGAELAQMFTRAGVGVTFVFRSRLLPEAEPEIGRALQGYLADEGIGIVAGATYRSIRQIPAGIALAIRHDTRDLTLEAERVLVATGRTPNADELGLEELGIARGVDGAILVDDRMRTSRAGVYAAGDVTGRDDFVYMAAYGARIAAKNALNGDSLRYDNAAMPAVVFTDPQVGSVGLTEAEARAAGHDVQTSVLSLDNVPRALAARDTRGLIKLVADRRTRKLLGAHLVAPEGADSIQTAALAIRCG